ncbi:hypothetical protein PF005_g32181, partial [Phytophthora fragariae]
MEPDGAVLCDLSTDPADPHALVYTIPVSPNAYDVLRNEGYDTSLPPDVDSAVATVDEDAVGPALLPTPPLSMAGEVRKLKSARKMDLKVNQVTNAELQREMDEFVDKDVLAFMS